MWLEFHKNNKFDNLYIYKMSVTETHKNGVTLPNVDVWDDVTNISYVEQIKTLLRDVLQNERWSFSEVNETGMRSPLILRC